MSKNKYGFQIGSVIRAKKEITNVDMQTLVEAGEIVKCENIEEPNFGSLYEIHVQHFGFAETTVVKLALEDFKVFELVG